MTAAFITSVYLRDNNKFDTRCFGFCIKTDDAIELVRLNVGDLHENLYNYLVIEELGIGIHPTVQKEIWFAWKEGWQPRAKPTELVGVVNFALG